MRWKNQRSVRAPSCTGYLGGVISRRLSDLWLTFVGPLGNKTLAHETRVERVVTTRKAQFIKRLSIFKQTSS